MSDPNQNFADSIAMLEQILEVMPQDIDALKALYSANLKCGMPNKAFDYLSKLMDLAAGNGEMELFAFLEEQLPRFEQSHPSEAAAQQARLRTLQGVHKINKDLSRSRQQEVEGQQVIEDSAESKGAEELALAWRLYEESQISQDEYSTVLHDLTEISSKNLDVPASVLHVLKDRGFANSSRVISYLSERSEVPFISLTNFEFPEEVAGVLPDEFISKDGALPFGFLGNDLLVAVLNPFNNELVDRVEKESGHTCHTYLVEADDYDEALARFRALTKSAA